MRLRRSLSEDGLQERFLSGVRENGSDGPRVWVFIFSLLPRLKYIRFPIVFENSMVSTAMLQFF